MFFLLERLGSRGIFTFKKNLNELSTLENSGIKTCSDKNLDNLTALMFFSLEGMGSRGIFTLPT